MIAIEITNLESTQKIAVSGIDYYISTAVLDWTAETQATNRNDLAEPVASKKYQKFLESIANQSQADKLIGMANIPFGFLFLSQSPPEDFGKPSLPDSRAVQDSESLSADFYAVLSDIDDKADWCRDYLCQIDRLPESLPSVGKFGLKDTVGMIAIDIIVTVNYDVNERRERSEDGYLGCISSLLEQVGVSAFEGGIVGGSIHRKLSVREFRGFAIADKQVPTIPVNGANTTST